MKTTNIGSALADYIKEKPYGSFIYYQDIERITDTKFQTMRYYTAIQKAKRILESEGKAIKCTGKGTYQVLYPGDYVTAYAREVRLAKNRVKHGGKVLKGAPKKDMTQEEMQSFNHVSDFHARLDASIKGNYVEVKQLAKKHPLQIESK